jgi:hypothetical protein
VDAVMAALGPRLEAIEGRFEQSDKEKADNEAKAAVRTALDEAKGEHEKAYGQGSWTTAETADKDGPNVEDTVLQLALRYTGQPDAVKRGYQDYIKLVGNAENGLLSRKGGEPTRRSPAGRRRRRRRRSRLSSRPRKRRGNSFGRTEAHNRR